MKKEDDLDDFLNEIDPEGLTEDINVDEIDAAAEEGAFAMCKNLREIYFDEEFMSHNPRLKERLDAEIESLRVLIKMRKSDEKVHDLCLRSIGLNGNNASLYAALSRIQSSMLSIQKQMDDTVKNINSILKNVQLEFNFDTPGDTTKTNEENGSITRGTKSFVQEMQKQLKEEAGE